jgi:hypothetical protein
MLLPRLLHVLSRKLAHSEGKTAHSGDQQACCPQLHNFLNQARVRDNYLAVCAQHTLAYRDAGQFRHTINKSIVVVSKDGIK